MIETKEISKTLFEIKGLTNSGKTTLLCEEIKKRNLKTLVIFTEGKKPQLENITAFTLVDSVEEAEAFIEKESGFDMVAIDNFSNLLVKSAEDCSGLSAYKIRKNFLEKLSEKYSVVYTANLIRICFIKGSEV